MAPVGQKKKKNTKINKQLFEPVGIFLKTVEHANSKGFRYTLARRQNARANRRDSDVCVPARTAVDGLRDGKMGEKKMYAITVQVDRACRVVASVEHDDAGHGSGCHRGSRSKHKWYALIMKSGQPGARPAVISGQKTRRRAATPSRAAAQCRHVARVVTRPYDNYGPARIEYSLFPPPHPSVMCSFCGQTDKVRSLIRH